MRGGPMSRAHGQTAPIEAPSEHRSTRCPQPNDRLKKHAKARRHRYRKAQERLARDRRQSQHAVEAIQQAVDDLWPPEDLVTEIEGRLRSQHKFLGKIVGVMFPPLFGCRTSSELCRVAGPGLSPHERLAALRRYSAATGRA